MILSVTNNFIFFNTTIAKLQSAQTQKMSMKSYSDFTPGANPFILNFTTIRQMATPLQPLYYAGHMREHRGNMCRAHAGA